MTRGNILIIDDEEKLLHLLKRIVSMEGFTVFEADSLKSAAKLLDREIIEIILCDVRLPDGNGVDFIEKVRSKYQSTEIIMLTAYGNISDGVKSIKLGAFDYLIKGNDNERIIPLLDRAMEKVRLHQKVAQLEKQVNIRYGFDAILGTSRVIKAAIAMAEKVAPTDATVLLLGKTGTGKEIFAKAIHQASKRSQRPFVALNVSSFSKDLLESELFGHTAGAFTSAIKNKRGLFEEADNGTLFLDEIGEMAFDLQAKLLRVLETSEFIKVGDTRPTKVSVRIITATNRDLNQEVEEGKFREDLFYRLNTFTICLPSLFERKEDIPLLAHHFLQIYSSKTNGQVKSISIPFIKRLMEHEWKGNIRELKNVIERAVIFSTSSELTPGDLPLDFQNDHDRYPSFSAFEMASVEKLHIQRVINHTGGNKMAAAKLLNIGLTTLYRKLEEYHIQSPADRHRLS